MKYLLALLMTITLAGCLGSGGGGGNSNWSWETDPRLEDIRQWAHNGGAIATGMPTDSYVPPVKGVNGTWGSGYFGQYFSTSKWRTSKIMVQIDRPGDGGEKHVQDIMAHEMGHYFKHMKTGNA